MIRVAQVVRPATGGIRRHVSQLIARLDEGRYESLLCAPAGFLLDAEAGDVSRFDVAIGAQFHPIADCQAIVMLSRRLQGNCELIHAHGLRGALIGIPAARLAGVPAIFTAHNVLPPTGIVQRAVLRCITATSTTIVCVSQAVANSLTAVGLAADKIRIIPNGINLAELDNCDTPIDGEAIRVMFGIPPNAMLIVAAGRLSYEKGYDILLEAFEVVQELIPEAHLLLAGSGREENALRANAGSNVDFCGQIMDIRALLSIADIVAIPSRSEGQSLVALEAMAAGKPVVASKVGGLPETVLNGETGLLVPPGDASALAKSLIELLQNVLRRAAFGHAGRQRIETHFTLDRMIESLEAVYDEVCEKH